MTDTTPRRLLAALGEIDQMSIAKFRKTLLRLASETDDNRAALSRVSYRRAKNTVGYARTGMSVGKPPVLVADVLWEVEGMLDGRPLPRYPALSAEDVGAALRLSVLVFSLLQRAETQDGGKRHRRRPAKKKKRSRRAKQLQAGTLGLSSGAVPDLHRGAVARPGRAGGRRAALKGATERD
jgi:hypothetical protein